MIKRIMSFILIVVIVSMLGFITENAWILIRAGYVDNRSMLFPGLLGYGLAILGIYFIFGTPEEPKFLMYKFSSPNRYLSIIIYMLMVGVSVAIGEIVLGTTMEKMCDIVWWNYSPLPLHIGKYTSVPTSVGFASMITLFMGKIFPVIQAYAFDQNSLIGYFITMSCLIILIVDYIHSMQYMYHNKRIYHRWKYIWSEKSLYYYEEQTGMWIKEDHSANKHLHRHA